MTPAYVARCCAYTRKNPAALRVFETDAASHVFDEGNPLAERNTRWVVLLTASILHVLADAATSLFAIVALFGGKLWGAVWLDPVMGLVGAALVSIWAYGLLRDTSRVLIDAEMDRPVVAEVREVVAKLPVAAEIADLHVWRVGRDKYACILSLVATEHVEPEAVRQALSVHEELVHITVEINHHRLAPDAAARPEARP